MSIVTIISMREPPLILDEFLPYRLSFTSNLVSDLIAGAYWALFGLSIPEWRLVAIAAEVDGIAQGEIAARSRMDKVTVSRAAIALARRGLVARRKNPCDGRSHLLMLTREGRALHAAIAPKAKQLEALVMGEFTAEEKYLLRTMLGRIDTATLALLEQPTSTTYAGRSVRFDGP